MKVLMLGWEYPPHINGGLGTACQGLTTALSDMDIDIDFVLPHVHGDEDVRHMQLMPADAALPITGKRKIRTFKIHSFLKPYLRPASHELISTDETVLAEIRAQNQFFAHDLFGEVDRYAELVTRNFAHGEYDLIHAHDWMTFPAAAALSEMTGTPMVAHVHSIEADRCGGWGNQTIELVERTGVTRAHRIIAVSGYTKGRVMEQYNVPEDKISVVHNGVQLRTSQAGHNPRDEKLVLFLGRVTYQKGPDYFVRAAQKVLERLPNTRFAVAGDGDMLPAIKQLASDLGIAANFSFPGFLTGSDVSRVYSEAAVYVMPSVSEPFGIAPLEAISNGTPVILSKQSGVSEVLRHALKIDFWDVDKLADYIENALAFSELRDDLVSMSTKEARSLSWERAGNKIAEVYQTISA